MRQKQETSFKMINEEIAYINNGSLKVDEISEIWKKIKDTKGLIIDIRNYPTDFPLYELTSYLLPESLPFTRITTASVEQPGLFKFTNTVNVGKKNDQFYKGKVILLVNETTQSSGEFHAMAYRVHPNSVVIGSTTAGADGNVSEVNLPGGIVTMISGVGIYYPDGTETQRIGIVPDIEVKPTIKGIINGKDELMEKAIKVINK